MEACWDCAGLNCEVLVGGEIRAGDAVVIGSEAQPQRVDGGVQAPGFFERPSKRTRAQIHAAQRFSADRLPALLNSDPGGVVRAVTSFNSVGLQFFKRPKRFRRGEAIQDRFCTMVETRRRLQTRPDQTPVRRATTGSMRWRRGTSGPRPTGATGGSVPRASDNRHPIRVRYLPDGLSSDEASET